MKKYSPVYSQNCVIYWPSFAGGIGSLCFAGFTLLIYFTSIILFLSDSCIAYETIGGIAFVTVLLLLWLIFTLRIVVRSMFCRITITNKGFSIFNKVTATDTHILWEQVSRIEFKQECYRGRKQYQVYLKPAMQGRHIALPISMVNEEKLYSIIPTELLINKPYSV